MAGTITGTYQTGDLQPATGLVRLTPALWIRTGAAITAGAPWDEVLTSGAFTVDVEPGAYRVQELVDGAEPTDWVVNVAEGATVDLRTAGPAAPAYLTQIRTVGGVSPDATGDIPIASIPGTPGPAGADGAAASVTVGSTTTLAAGDPATVANSGTSAAAVLDFGIPAGPQGTTGAQGPKGDTGDTGPAGADGSDGATGPEGPAGPSNAERFGLLALTFAPAATADVDPDVLAMVADRLYAWWLPLPVGTTVHGVAVPIADLGAGAGEVRFTVYQEDLSQLGDTGDVGNALTTGSTNTWRDLPLGAAAATTGAGVWVTGRSRIATGPSMVTAPTASAGAWVYNRGAKGQARRLEGVAVMPTTLDPAGMIAYIDFLIGVY